MLLRRITQHVKDQNWFAVGIDFIIVVFGVFIGIQVSNWNNARASKIQETAILVQLQDEFTEIQEALSLQTEIREGYVADLKSLVAGLEDKTAPPEDIVIKRALNAARSTGRRPAESSAYLQLTTNGDLARLSNENLKKALIRYHARLERDAFIFPELMRMVVEEISSNAFVEFDTDLSYTGAAIDQKSREDQFRPFDGIKSYDFEGLRQYEQRYETFFIMHGALVNTDKTQLEIVDEILGEISGELN